MRYFIGVFILAVAATGCMRVPDYDASVNPFIEEFDGSFVEVSRVEKGYNERNGLLSYKVYFRLNEKLIIDEVRRVEVHVDGRPDDHFFIPLIGVKDLSQEFSFDDQKVELGKTHTYRFYLAYKNELSQQSNPSLELTIEEP